MADPTSKFTLNPAPDQKGLLTSSPISTTSQTSHPFTQDEMNMFSHNNVIKDAMGAWNTIGQEVKKVQDVVHSIPVSVGLPMQKPLISTNVGQIADTLLPKPKSDKEAMAMGLVKMPGSNTYVGLDVGALEDVGSKTIPGLTRELTESSKQVLVDALNKADQIIDPALREQIKQTTINLVNEGKSIGSLVTEALREQTRAAGKTINKFTQEVVPEAFKGFEDLTTKILDRLKGKTEVSKQFIQDLTNMPELKQAERDLIRNVVSDMPDKVPVQDFANKVKTELLPLERGDVSRMGERPGAPITRNMYENITLPDNLRGPVVNYSEHIYQSPIETSAGDVHFGVSEAPNYFAHTRIEDLPSEADAIRIKNSEGNQNIEAKLSKPGDTRRVIELQSDLFQKGRLEGEADVHQWDYVSEGALKKYNPEVYNEYQKLIAKIMPAQTDLSRIPESTLAHYERLGISGEKLIQLNKAQNADWLKEGRLFTKADEIRTREIENQMSDYVKRLEAERAAEIAKLEPYRNTWQDRIIREEVKQAAIDGKTKLQFPTGETAMKIERLGDTSNWRMRTTTGWSRLENDPYMMKVGNTINDGNSDWIITKVLPHNQFKAVPKDSFERFINRAGFSFDTVPQSEYSSIINNSTYPLDISEVFDISGKINTNDPIYKFYEKEVGRYLNNKYGATKITDPQGVTWWQINIKPDMAKLPIEAFAAAPLLFNQKQDNKQQNGFTQDEINMFNHSPTIKTAMSSWNNTFDSTSNTRPSINNAPSKLNIDLAANAITSHESRGVASPETTVAGSTGATGASQITPIMLKQYNKITGKNLTMKDLLNNPQTQKDATYTLVSYLNNKYKDGLSDWPTSTAKLKAYKNEINTNFNSPIYWIAGEWVAGPNWVAKLDNPTAPGATETVRDYIKRVGDIYNQGQ